MADATAEAGSVSDRVPLGARGFSYGWIIVVLLFTVALTVQGMAIGGITIFDDRLLKALGVSRGAFKFRDLIYILSASSCAFAMAWVCERIGVRLTIIAGLLTFSGVMAGYSSASTIGTVYLLQALLGAAYATIHVVVVMVILSRWFDADDPRRGIALGISVSGASCGAVVMSQVIAALLGGHEWRQVFLILAFPPLLLVPLVWWFVRPPHDGRVGWGLAKADRAGFSFKVLGSPAAILLLIAIVPVFYVSACAASHTALMLRDHGLSVQVAAAAVSTMFLFGLAGKFGSGFVLLRLKLLTSWFLFSGAIFLGALLLAIAPIPLHLPALALIGLGWGGCFPLSQLQIAQIFDGPGLARILAVFVLLESIGSASGAWVPAMLFDRFGSYSVPFAINVVLIVAGLVASALLPGVARRGIMRSSR